MKLLEIYERQEGIKVAPLVGAWIEIINGILKGGYIIVAPLVGAWIEITALIKERWITKVAPLVGAWIEIMVPGERRSFELSLLL